MTQNDLKKIKYKVYPPKGIKTEWTVRFPEVNNIGGSGNTLEEALEDAYENLDAEISYLEDTNQSIPNPEETRTNNEALAFIKALFFVGETQRRIIDDCKKKTGILICSLGAKADMNGELYVQTVDSIEKLGLPIMVDRETGEKSVTIDGYKIVEVE